VAQLKKYLYERKKEIKSKNIRKWGYDAREMAILCHEFFGALLAT
jgi:hypothetical protein